MSAAYSIEKGIPGPGWNERNGHRSIYPWDEMEVGDSFFVPNVKQSRLSGSRSHRTRKSGHKYAIRAVDGGVRVWRTA